MPPLSRIWQASTPLSPDSQPQPPWNTSHHHAKHRRALEQGAPSLSLHRRIPSDTAVPWRASSAAVPTFMFPSQRPVTPLLRHIGRFCGLKPLTTGWLPLAVRMPLMETTRRNGPIYMPHSSQPNILVGQAPALQIWLFDVVSTRSSSKRLFADAVVVVLREHPKRKKKNFWRQCPNRHLPAIGVHYIHNNSSC